MRSGFNINALIVYLLGEQNRQVGGTFEFSLPLRSEPLVSAAVYTPVSHEPWGVSPILVLHSMIVPITSQFSPGTATFHGSSLPYPSPFPHDCSYT